MTINAKILYKILFIASILTFVGWGMMYLYWEVPVKAVFMNPYLMYDFITKVLKMDWQVYGYGSASDLFFFQVAYYIGYTFFGSALLLIVSAIFVKNEKIKLILARIALFVATFLLLFNAFGEYIEVGSAIVQFLESTAQFSLPLFLLYTLRHEIPSEKVILVAKIVIAITFVAHGLYAAGVGYRQPYSFIDMVLSFFKCDEATGRQILAAMGYMDFVIATLIFIPNDKIQRFGLIYCTAWGFITALARIVTHFYWDIWEHSLWEWTPQFLYRTANWALPLWVYLHYKKRY